MDGAKEGYLDGCLEGRVLGGDVARTIDGEDGVSTCSVAPSDSSLDSLLDSLLVVALSTQLAAASVSVSGSQTGAQSATRTQIAHH